MNMRTIVCQNCASSIPANSVECPVCRNVVEEVPLPLLVKPTRLQSLITRAKSLFPPPPSRSRPKWYRSRPFYIGIILGIILLIVFGIWLFLKLHSNSIGTQTISDGTLIGISDGSYAFDKNRTDEKLKLQATEQWRKDQNDFVQADQLFKQAVDSDPSDAEAQIYRENIRVLSLHKPFVIIVVSTDFSADRSDDPANQAILQGAYVAQREWNDGAKLHNGSLVRIFIANSGSDSASTKTVAQQILTFSHTPNFIGVMGWPDSDHTQNALNILHTIPIVSSIASSDELTDKHPYPNFFRVNPSDRAQGIDGADYAFKTLKAKNVAVFSDKDDSYSRSLAKAFTTQFQSDGGTIALNANFKTLDDTTIASLPSQLANLNYDLIYFSGGSSAVSVFLANLPPGGTIPVMGGDGFYVLGEYSDTAKLNWSRLIFTSFAYPDEWSLLKPDVPAPIFSSEYTNDFNSSGKDSGYGHSRADYVPVLSYDAIVALLTACNKALDQQKALTFENILWGLSQINASHPLSGASGQISFDSDGNPIDKAVVIIHIINGGNFTMDTGDPYGGRL